MLTIRDDQMRALEAASTADFRAKLASIVPPGPDAQAQIDRGLAQAAQFGFKTEKEIGQFFEIACQSEKGFSADKLPVPALSILMTHGMDPDEKLARYQQLTGASTTATQFSNQPAGSTVQPCPLQKKPETHWIEIELIGVDDMPIPWEQYQVALPDGTLADGYLDGEGFARLSGLPTAGTCKVKFPALDKDAWEFVATKAAKK